MLAVVRRVMVFVPLWLMINLYSLEDTMKDGVVAQEQNIGQKCAFLRRIIALSGKDLWQEFLTC